MAEFRKVLSSPRDGYCYCRDFATPLCGEGARAQTLVPTTNNNYIFFFFGQLHLNGQRHEVVIVQTCIEKLCAHVEQKVPAFSVQVIYFLLSLVAQSVKNLPAMWETQVGSLGWEDPLEKGTAFPVFLPKEFHGQRSLAGYKSWACKESDTTE